MTRYLRYGRPKYEGTAAEPLFLRDDGRGPLTANGISSLRGRLTARAHDAGLVGVMFHRARGYAAKRLQRRGVPINVIMQIGRWEASEMVRRYVGEYDPSELKQFPTAALDEVIR